VFGPASVGGIQGLHKQIATTWLSGFAWCAAIASPTIRMGKRAHDIEQPELVSKTDNMAA
jgi:hypothetical protein